MSDSRDKAGTTAQSEPDSFDLLLQQLAQLSAVVVSSATSLRAGDMLARGRFRIVRCVGKGGMGLVYEAWDEQRRGSVALKVLSQCNAANVYRLKNEFRSVADVSHSNLVRLHELFCEAECWFFTMELVDGESFDHWVRPNTNTMVDEARLRAALPQLCDGVAAIHRAGKLHRDLKPSNVLVTPAGRVVVLDFGLAVELEPGGVGQTIEDETVSGTPAFMAPEQAAGMPAHAASDFYALGVMLFEALTGRLPFEGRSHDMLVDKQRRDAPKVSDVYAGAPQDLAELCDALLARDPAQRPDGPQLRAATGERRSAPAISMRSHVLPRRDQLLGRAHELAELAAAYAATCAGKPIVMFVSGESGIGKSALCQSFLDGLRAADEAVVLVGRCHERESVPFKGMDSLLDDLSRFLHRLPHADAAALMPREAYALARLFPALGRIAAVAQSPKKHVVDAQELRLRAFASFCELLARIRDRRPLVLHIDDAQWLDRDALAFLAHVLGQQDAAPALLVLSHRSDPSSDQPWRSELHQRLRENACFRRCEMRLGPLPPEAAAALAARVLGAASEALASNVAAESNGSPFFIEELSRQAHATKGSTPLTLQAALLAHVQRLPADPKRLLEVLAVAGRPLAAEFACAVADTHHEQIDVLYAERLIRCSDGPQGIDVECYHDKIRETVVSSLSDTLLRAHHRALAEALLRLGASDPDNLCAHYQAAGELVLCAMHAAAAAQRAETALAFDRAAAFYGSALSFGQFEPERMHALRVARANALAQAGRGAVAADAYLAAAASAPQDEVPVLKRRAAEQHLYAGNLERGRELLDEALRPLGIPISRTTSGAIAALAYQRARVRLHGYQFRERVVTDPRVMQQLAALRGAGLALVRSDGLRGFELMARHLLLALKIGDPVEAARALAAELLCATFLGLDAARIRRVDEQAAALAARTGDVHSWVLLHFARGLAKFPEPEALPHYERCVALYCEQPLPDSSYNRAQAELQSLLVRTYMGRFAEVAHELPTRIDEAWARGDLCMVPVAAGSFASVARFATGDEVDAERDLVRARAAWPTNAFTIQDLALLQSEQYLFRFRGQARLAWNTMLSHWDGFERSPLRHASFLASQMRYMRASAAVMLASESRDLSERAALQSEAKRLAKTLKPLLALDLAAAQACQRGDVAAAISALRRAIPLFAPLGAHGLKRRLGVLLGGDEGRALVNEADRFFLAGGAVDVERLTAALSPGYELR